MNNQTKTENELINERRRADGYKRGLQNLLKDYIPLMVCMILLGCIFGACLSGWIFYGMGG